MTHEGRMARGEEKHKAGISDIETTYYLEHKVDEPKEAEPVEEPEAPKKETKKKESEDGKSD